MQLRTIRKTWLLVWLAVPGIGFAGILQVGPGETYTTIQSALDAANPNDTIEIQAGTYNEALVVVKDDGITLRRKTSVRPILVGRIEVAFRANVTIDGLEVTGWTGAGIHGINQSGGTGLTVRNSRVHDGPTVGSASCIYSRNSTNLLIENNEVFNCNKGVNIAAGHSTSNSYSTGIFIRGNTIHDNPIDGVDVHGEYITIEENTIHSNMNTNWVAYHPDGIQLIASIVDGFTAVKHCRIRYNRVFNHNQNIFVEGTSNRDTEDIHVHNNIVYNQSGTVNGVNLDLGFAASNIVMRRAKNVFVYNNTIGRVSNTGIRVQDCVSNSIYVRNNILDNSFKNGITVDVPSDIAVLDYNLYDVASEAVVWGSARYPTRQAFFQAVGREASGWDGDPLVNSYVTGQIGSGSAAINRGFSLTSEYRLSINGVNRPSGGAWDMGAYESSGTGIPQNPPAPPTGLRLRTP